MRACRGFLAAFAVLAVGVLGVPGCGNSSGSDFTADVSGNYSLNVTNRDNGCNFNNFDTGNSAANIPFSIAQTGSDVTGTIGGLVGLVAGALLGSNQFEGTVSGESITMTLYGTNSATEGNCVYSVNATLTATTTGDVLEGHIDYTKAGNGNPDCAAIDGCVSRQDFNGSRPPQ